jgi:putative ATP-binding cassette transporter
MLHIRWRKWMTDHYQNEWLSNQAYYRLQVIYKSTDNPDQRIADDIDMFTGSTLSLSIGLLSSVVTLLSFLGILWGLSGTLEFTVSGTAIAIPGYMVWVAIVYAFVGTWLTHKIGKRLVRLNYDQQRFEANFRFSMVRLRENAENIAFYKGEPYEKQALSERFSYIIGNWWEIMRKQKQLTWFTSAYAQIAIIFPVLVASPRYFSGAIQLGGLMQTASAFGQVQGALSWFIDVYSSFASWRATTDRLSGFTNAMMTSRTEAAVKNITTTPGQQFAVRRLKLTLPDGTPHIEGFEQALKPGDRLLLSGKSGSGKTTLLRALAGLWPYGEGEIILPEGANIMFVPQKPYLPIAPLRNVICYPQLPDHYNDEQLKGALAAVGLESLSGQLDTSEHWTQILSLGEQEKLAFSRMLLNKPDILLLDEATASLDEAAEASLYQTLLAKLPHTIIISVGHRGSLRAWHGLEKTLS